MLISLVGPNLFAKQRELQSLLKSTLRQPIYGSDGLASWYEQLGQGDLFGQSPALVAEKVLEDLPKRDQEVLAEYLVTQGAASSSQQIIFLVDDQKSLNKSQLGSLLAQQKLLRFPKPNAAKLQLWVQQEAARLGVVISKSLIQALIDKLGLDQYALQTELERWSLHQPAEITAETIRNLAPLQPETDAFGLTSAWEQKNSAKTLGALSALRLQGTASQMIIGMLGWKVESLLLATSHRQRASKWSQTELETAMLNLYQLDIDIKQGKADPELGLELWLLESMSI